MFLVQFVDAEFAVAVLAALSIPLVIVARLIVTASTSEASRARLGRFRLLARRPLRNLGLRSRRPAPVSARRQHTAPR
jgi:hypothetical protein